MGEPRPGRGSASVRTQYVCVEESSPALSLVEESSPTLSLRRSAFSDDSAVDFTATVAAVPRRGSQVSSGCVR